METEVIMEALVRKIIDGELITKEEAMSLWQVDLDTLLAASLNIKKHYHGQAFDLCTIINGKSGKCSEDCKYCAQSAHYQTGIESYPLQSKEAIIEDALNNEKNGIGRYSIVTSGKRASASDFQELLAIYEALGKETSMKLCSSHGLLNAEEFKALRRVGVVRYHNNLETSKNFFKEICTTHTFEDKVEAIKAAQAAGLEVCSGGIMGLGESEEDRVDMAFSLRELGIKSIPLNMLSPIENTPLASIKAITEEEFLRTCAIFRFINPTAVIRLAGGRNLLSDFGKRAFESSVNGTISGDLLTTYGNSTGNDIKLITSIGYEIVK